MVGCKERARSVPTSESRHSRRFPGRTKKSPIIWKVVYVSALSGHDRVRVQRVADSSVVARAFEGTVRYRPGCHTSRGATRGATSN
jgi:hypothetical protein